MQTSKTWHRVLPKDVAMGTTEWQGKMKLQEKTQVHLFMQTVVGRSSRVEQLMYRTVALASIDTKQLKEVNMESRCRQSDSQQLNFPLLSLLQTYWFYYSALSMLSTLP